MGIRCPSAGIGHPQCGHTRARVEISQLQSGQGFSGIAQIVSDTEASTAGLVSEAAEMSEREILEQRWATDVRRSPKSFHASFLATWEAEVYAGRRISSVQVCFRYLSRPIGAKRNNLTVFLTVKALHLDKLR